MQVKRIIVTTEIRPLQFATKKHSLDSQIDIGTFFLNISITAILASVYLEILKTF